MTTIPLEVIVQDVESPANPTPTPETNSTETNITVPNTGTEALGNNTFSSSSAASIIIPVVLLVLSLATICTLLIHRHTHQDSKASKKEKLTTFISTTIAFLSSTVLLSNLVLPATKAATSDPEVDIQVPDKISIVVNREQDITESTTETTAYIASTSTFGYKVLLSMAEDVDTANLYLNGDNTNEYYIAPVENETFSTNTWGYTLAGEETYNQVPLLDTPATIAQGNEPVENEELSIYYGVNIDKSIPEGTYSGELEYSAIAMGPTIGTLTYMQDFATLSENAKASVITSMAEETTYTLKDKRDNQDYTIAKLKDGKVWMTKNLNLAGGSTITSELSDVPEGYILPTNNGFQEGNKLPSSSQDGFSSYRRAYIYNTDNNTDTCSAPGCYSYYSWTAATAGSGLDITASDADAPYSICPKGWKLPNARSSSSANWQSAGFYRLAIAYGMDESVTSQSSLPDFYDHAGPNTIPNFLLTGYYYSGSYSAGGSASFGFYWSSTSGPYDGSAFSLRFRSSYVNSANIDDRSYGYAIRCIAR